MKKIGIALVIIGLLITIFTSISFTTEESLLEIGDLEVTHEKENEVNWPRWAGVLVMVGGAALILFDRKK
jgi:uncharacterized membrane protein YdcZ (DUF606 family)